MPCLEISVPKLDTNIKSVLVERLTKAYVDSTGLEARIFGIRFFEYSIGDSANEGVLWDGSNGKPYHHFIFNGPRLSYKAKQKLVVSMTEAYISTINNPNWKPVFFINEYSYDNIGAEGEILSGREDGKFANRKFYFEMKD